MSFKSRTYCAVKAKSQGFTLIHPFLVFERCTLHAQERFEAAILTDDSPRQTAVSARDMFYPNLRMTAIMRWHNKRETASSWV